MRGMSVLLAAGAVIAAVAGPARADEYHDADRGFALDVPAGWVVMSESELKLTNAVARDAWAEFDISFTAGFRPAGESRGEDDPVILVQVDAEVKPGTPFEDFVKDYQAARTGARRGSRESALHMFHLSATGEPTVDEKKQRIFSKDPAGGPGPSRTHANYAHLGPDKLVILHFIGPKAAWKKSKHLFVNVSDSLRFDPPPSGLRSWWRTAGSPGEGVGLPALVGGAVGVGTIAIGLVVFATGRKTPAARRWS